MKILFVHNARRTFVRLDRDLLARKNTVAELDFRWTPQTLMALYARVSQCDVVYAWFASHHSVLPILLGKRLKKKILVCAVDYDLANEPAYRYGSMRGGLPKAINNRIFGAADWVLVPSEFSQQLALRHTTLKHTPGKVLVIPLGVPAQARLAVNKIKRAITIATLHRVTNWRKGVTTFVQTAAYLPEVGFDVVGRASDDSLAALKRAAGANVMFHGEVTDGQRDALMARAALYAQLSYMEGFGLALAEGMLQECVPVVTRRGSLPEVVGDCGIYVPYDHPAGTAEGIRAALAAPELGRRARQRILDLFPLERRAERLNQVLTRC